jgi:L-2-hydroxycarboxylate dehydrogenase (NAD+)
MTARADGVRTDSERAGASVVTVPVARQMELLVEVFRGLGATEEEAFVQADVLTEADLRGVPSHGLQRLPVLFERVRKGLLRVSVEPVLEWTGEAVLCVDGRDGLGTAIAEASLRELIPTARRFGIAALAIRDTSHLGMLGYYCNRRAEEGFVCIGMTTSEVLVHPYGGAEALVGTNPLAIGIPAEPRPFVFDMATSIVPMGRVLAHLHRGQPLEEGWAIDAQGQPTTDPAAAAKGSIAPMAGPKGYGLGVSIGILAGLLSGGDIGRAVRGTLDTRFRCTKGDLFFLLDPAAFAGGEALAEGVGRYLDELRGSKPQAGFDRVMVPGDRGFEVRRERLEGGIPHPEEIWHAAERLHAAIRD